MSDGTDYSISVRDAEWLSGMVSLPLDIRRMVLTKYAEQHGIASLIEAFAQFTGVAGSVVANGAEMCSISRIVEGAEHPERPSSRLNLPTIFGALQGAILADRVTTHARCSTCAFRLGTIANQSPVTTCDADYCVRGGGRDFMCHEGVGEHDEPTSACAGYAQKRRMSA